MNKIENKNGPNCSDRLTIEVKTDKSIVVFIAVSLRTAHNRRCPRSGALPSTIDKSLAKRSATTSVLRPNRESVKRESILTCMRYRKWVFHSRNILAPMGVLKTRFRSHGMKTAAARRGYDGALAHLPDAATNFPIAGESNFRGPPVSMCRLVVGPAGRSNGRNEFQCNRTRMRH